MKRTSLSLLLIVLGALALPGPAAAKSSYCSASGDVCYGLSSGSDPKISLGLAARYFDVARICVSPPSGRRSCGNFAVKKYGSIYGVRIRWSSKFPNKGAGTYKVKFYNGADSLGPAVSFKR
jgi:hypothetical protein